MKKHLLSLLAVIALTLTGCTTTQTGKTIPDPTVLRITAQEAAALGGQFWLSNHPQDRQAFILAQTSLKALIATGNGSPAELQSALASLPIKELNGTNGSVIVAGAVVLIDAAGRQLLKLDKAQVWSAYVEPIAQGLAAGLDQALATPVPAKP
jgi:hypothetical protein